jgi:hypothetical protein
MRYGAKNNLYLNYNYVIWGCFICHLDKGDKYAQVKRGYVNKAKLSYGKKRLSAENYRSWSESMEPEKRAYIMELKEALRQRMEQRGIERDDTCGQTRTPLTCEELAEVLGSRLKY